MVARRIQVAQDLDGLVGQGAEGRWDVVSATAEGCQRAQRLGRAPRAQPVGRAPRVRAAEVEHPLPVALHLCVAMI